MNIYQLSVSTENISYFEIDNWINIREVNVDLDKQIKGIVGPPSHQGIPSHQGMDVGGPKRFESKNKCLSLRGFLIA